MICRGVSAFSSYQLSTKFGQMLRRTISIVFVSRVAAIHDEKGMYCEKWLKLLKGRFPFSKEPQRAKRFLKDKRRSTGFVV